MKGKRKTWIAVVIALMVLGLTGCHHQVESDFDGGELLSVCWRQAIEGLSGAPANDNFVLCLPQISAENVESTQINYFTASTTKTKCKYVWNGSELVWSWRFDNMASCTENTYEQITSESMLLMKGFVHFENDNLMNESQRSKSQKNENQENGALRAGSSVCHAALGYAGKRYQEKNGSVEGSWYAVAYLTEYNYDEEAPGGECWIRLGEEEWIKLTVAYTPEAGPIDGSEFSFAVDEEAVFCEEIESEALAICSLNLTTEKPGADERAWMSDAWDRFDDYGDLWQTEVINGYSCYMDLLGQELPAMDYDGDGLTDRVYWHRKACEEDEIWLFFGDGGAVLLCDAFAYGSPRGELESLDVNGDGRPEVIYTVQIYANGAGHDTALIGIWEKSDGEWQLMPMWGVGECFWNLEIQHVLYIPLELEKLSEHEIRATQPDTGATETVWITDEQMKLTWVSKENKVSTLVKGSHLSLIQEPDTGPWKLRVSGDWGDRGEWIGVDWELVCRDGEWVLSDCAIREQ